MPISPNFSAAQDVLYPNVVILVDTSTGSDSSITSRRVYCRNSNGTYLVPAGTTTDYTVWAYSASTISLDILVVDTALSIRVDWVDDAGETVESLTQQFCFSLFNKQFLYSLVESQGLTPNIVQDTTYFSNLANMWSLTWGAINSVEINDDIAASQNCLNQATYMRQNESLFF